MNRTQGIFCAVTVLYWFSLYTYVPILPVYAASLGASYKLVGLIVGSYGVIQLFLRIPQGVLSDRWRKRKIFVVGAMCVSSLSAIGMFWFQDAISLLLFRGLSGVAATAWVIIVVLFASYFTPSEAPKAYGIMNSVSFAGQVAGMFAGGLVAEVWGLTSTFMLAAVGAALGLGLCAFVTENAPKAGPPLRLSQVPVIMRNHHVLLASSMAILVQLLSYGTVYGFIPVAAHNMGATNFELGLLTTMASLPSIFASMLSGTWFIARLGRRATLCIGFVLMAFSAAIVPVLDNLFQLFGTQLIGGFGRGLVFPLLMAFAVTSVEERIKATAMGVFQSLYAFGMFAGPVMVGAVGDFSGLNTGFFLCGLVGLAGAGIAARYAGEK